MDLLLESFLDECYGDLAPHQQLAFARLLDESDVDILNWVTGKSRPGEASYNAIVEILQKRMKP